MDFITVKECALLPTGVYSYINVVIDGFIYYNYIDIMQLKRVEENLPHMKTTVVA